MPEYLKRGAVQTAERSRQIYDTVSAILSDVEREGEPAVRRYSEQLDGWSPGRFTVDIDAAKTVTYQKLDAIGAKATALVSASIADAEMMLGHALTARLRLEMD